MYENQVKNSSRSILLIAEGTIGEVLYEGVQRLSICDWYAYPLAGWAWVHYSASSFFAHRFFENDLSL